MNKFFITLFDENKLKLQSFYDMPFIPRIKEYIGYDHLLFRVIDVYYDFEEDEVQLTVEEYEV